MEFAVGKACRDLERIWEHGSQKLGEGRDPKVLEDVANKLESDSKKVSAKHYRALQEKNILCPPPRTVPWAGFEESKTDEGWACPSADCAANVARLCVVCRGNLRVEYRIEGPASFSLALRRHLVCTTRQPRVAAAWSVISWAPAPRV
eukprot:GHVU01138230.1.p1 GENE.GHVU01138230.1~~GHVU01138230.1.p1  ORF type:complete len:148 (+),score=3.64 GHVU01138230.1:431-874(+)